MKNIANVSYIKNAVNIKLISDKVNPIFIFELLYTMSKYLQDGSRVGGKRSVFEAFRFYFPIHARQKTI